MSKTKGLRVLVEQFLSATADQIVEAVEKIISDYEEEMLQSKQEISRQRKLLAADGLLQPKIEPNTLSEEAKLNLSVWEKNLTEQQQECNSNGRQKNSEALQTERKHNEPLSISQDRRPEDDHMHYILTAQCVKNEYEIIYKVEEEPLPVTSAEQIPIETDEEVQMPVETENDYSNDYSNDKATLIRHAPTPHTDKDKTLTITTYAMVNVDADIAGCFSGWKYKHYFDFLLKKDNKNIEVKCKLCQKTLSTSIRSNSNLLKHLKTMHRNMILEAKDLRRISTTTHTSDSDGPTPPKQTRVDCKSSQQLDRLIASYVVEEMLPFPTVESVPFRELVSKIPIKAVPMCRNTFSKYLDSEYSKMEDDLKNKLDALEFLSTTADLWTAHNKSFLGVTAHWINPQNMQREKAALACKRFKGQHTYNSIATELDNIHSSHGISQKITATITDNGSNFVKAFKKYQPCGEDEHDAEDDDVTFTNIGDVLLNGAADDYVIAVPPHQRCASHTLNLISCTDVDRWLLSRPETKALYRSATTKCSGLWNKASQPEFLDDDIAKKLLVPPTTRWNLFYNAVDRISGIPVVELSTLSSKLQLKCISGREHLFLREYSTVMKPLTMALDILQGEENCFFGTLLPTLDILMSKTLKTKNGLQILDGLPDAIVQAIKTRFSTVLESTDAVLAAVTLPKFKLRWLHDKARRYKAKERLLSECQKQHVLEQERKATNPTPQHSTGSAKEEFFSFTEDEDTSSTAEAEVAEYLKSPATEIDSVNQFPLIKKISLRYNAATPSSAPVERLFSLDGIILSPKRNRLSDQTFERLLILRYNHWFKS